MESNQDKLSSDWKLIMTNSTPRIIHARGCEYIKNWNIDGLLEIYKFRPEKHHICRHCEYLAYTTIGAKDYAQNCAVYKKQFKDVPVRLLKQLFVEKRAKCFVNGNRIYFIIKNDSFYVDFNLDEIHLYHANYKVLKRELNQDSFQGGYHEHKLPNPKISSRRQKTVTMTDAIKDLCFYEYKNAEKVHKQNRKKKPKITLSEYDPELYGFTD